MRQHRSGASALDRARGQVVSAGGAFVPVVVLADSDGTVVGSGGVALVGAVGSGGGGSGVIRMACFRGSGGVGG